MSTGKRERGATRTISKLLTNFDHGEIIIVLIDEYLELFFPSRQICEISRRNDT